MTLYLLCDQCPYFFSQYQILQVSFFVHIENDDGQVVFLAEGEGCHVHDIEVFFVYLLERNIGIPFGSRVFFWICNRKSTRLNSSHVTNSYAVLRLKKKN